MEIYLPIAGISENLFLILGLGAGVGMLSGMFGVGGGFLLTPLLMQIGIPPPIAVASAANQVGRRGHGNRRPTRWSVPASPAAWRTGRGATST